MAEVTTFTFKAEADFRSVALGLEKLDRRAATVRANLSNVQAQLATTTDPKQVEILRKKRNALERELKQIDRAANYQTQSANYLQKTSAAQREMLSGARRVVNEQAAQIGLWQRMRRYVKGATNNLQKVDRSSKSMDQEFRSILGSMASLRRNIDIVGPGGVAIAGIRTLRSQLTSRLAQAGVGAGAATAGGFGIAAGVSAIAAPSVIGLIGTEAAVAFEDVEALRRSLESLGRFEGFDPSTSIIKLQEALKGTLTEEETLRVALQTHRLGLPEVTQNIEAFASDIADVAAASSREFDQLYQVITRTIRRGEFRAIRDILPNLDVGEIRRQIASAERAAGRFLSATEQQGIRAAAIMHELGLEAERTGRQFSTGALDATNALKRQQVAAADLQKTLGELAKPFTVDVRSNIANLLSATNDLLREFSGLVSKTEKTVTDFINTLRTTQLEEFLNATPERRVELLREGGVQLSGTDSNVLDTANSFAEASRVLRRLPNDILRRIDTATTAAELEAILLQLASENRLPNIPGLNIRAPVYTGGANVAGRISPSDRGFVQFDDVKAQQIIDAVDNLSPRLNRNLGITDQEYFRRLGAAMEAGQEQRFRNETRAFLDSNDRQIRAVDRLEAYLKQFPDDVEEGIAAGVENLDEIKVEIGEVDLPLDNVVADFSRLQSRLGGSTTLGLREIGIARDEGVQLRHLRDAIVEQTQFQRQNLLAGGISGAILNSEQQLDEQFLKLYETVGLTDAQWQELSDALGRSRESIEAEIEARRDSEHTLSQLADIGNAAANALRGFLFGGQSLRQSVAGFGRSLALSGLNASLSGFGQAFSAAFREQRRVDLINEQYENRLELPAPNESVTNVAPPSGRYTPRSGKLAALPVDVGDDFYQRAATAQVQALEDSRRADPFATEDLVRIDRRSLDILESGLARVVVREGRQAAQPIPPPHIGVQNNYNISTRTASALIGYLR